MKYLLAAILALFTITASADEILVHGLSYHGKRTYTDRECNCQVPYNERNLGVTYFRDDGWGVGVYKNSYGKTAVHASYRHMWTDNFGAFIGLASGYKDHGSGLIGGLIARTPAYHGWRLVAMGQPFTEKYRIVTLSVSKEF